MTTSPGATGTVPQWTLGDRLRKARILTGLNASDFAAVIGVSPKTINNAEGDKHSVRPIVLNAWALATGVDREWLETGAGVAPQPPDGHGPTTPTARLEQLAARKRSRHAGNGATRRYLLAA